MEERFNLVYGLMAYFIMEEKADGSGCSQGWITDPLATIPTWQIVHISGIINILKSPLQLRLYPHSFTPTSLQSSMQDIQPCYTLDDLGGLLEPY